MYTNTDPVADLMHLTWIRPKKMPSASCVYNITTVVGPFFAFSWSEENDVFIATGYSINFM